MKYIRTGLIKLNLKKQTNKQTNKKPPKKNNNNKNKQTKNRPQNKQKHKNPKTAQKNNNNKNKQTIKNNIFDYLYKSHMDKMYVRFSQWNNWQLHNVFTISLSNFQSFSCLTSEFPST